MPASLSDWLGGLIMLAAIFLPAFLLVAGTLPHWEQLRLRMAVQRAMEGINAAVVGSLGAAFYDVIWTSAIHNPSDVGLALAAYGLLVFGKTPPLIVVMLTGVEGWLLKGCAFSSFL